MGQPYAYAKNFATFCPMGPWIVTAKELGDPRNLKMDVRINGKVTRSGNSREMIFDPFEVLAYCSDYTPMEAGDIIALGTFCGRQEDRRRRRRRARRRTDRHACAIASCSRTTTWPNFTAGAPTGPLVQGKISHSGSEARDAIDAGSECFVRRNDEHNRAETAGRHNSPK